MKRYIRYTLMLLAAVVFTACSKEDIPMTSTVDLAGEWMVTVETDGASYGPYMFITYNTNKNDGQEIWLDDLGNFYGTKVKIPCNVSSLTFGSDTPADNAAYDPITVKVTEGKVVFGGTKSPSGMPADAIEFKLEYSDDPGTIYTAHGYRRTGLQGGAE